MAESEFERLMKEAFDGKHGGTVPRVYYHGCDSWSAAIGPEGGFLEFGKTPEEAIKKAIAQKRKR